MSGIVGIWNLNGQPVEKNLLRHLSATLSHRGPDGQGIWIRGPVGLACQNFWVTPESEKEIQPAVHPSGPVLVFDGRLDNREEILASLKGSHEVSAASSDAALILAAYLTVGERLPEWLVGDFALALFDPKEPRLLLARDALGVRPLYYCRTQDTFLFASEIKAILAHPDVTTRPNDDLLADFLLGSLQDPNITFFDGIFTLPPAHTTLLTLKGFTKRRYWDFDPETQIRLGSFQEYAEAFREVFEQSVKRRSRSTYPVAVSVSGGLDSSSIFCSALSLSQNGLYPHPKLLGASYTSPDGTPSDEKSFLLDIEKEYGISIHRVPIGPEGFVEGSQEAVWHIEAPFLDEQWAITHKFLRRVHDLGARVMLTGHWGDQFLFPQAYLVDLFRGLAWGKIRSHLKEFRLWVTDADPKWFYKSFFLGVAAHYLPASLLPLVRWLRYRRDRPWYSDVFQDRARKRLWKRTPVGRDFPTAHATSLYEEARTEYYVLCMEWQNKVAAMHGLEVAFPFFDRDLLSFLMAIPGEVLTHNGVPKALLRESMRGVLPEEIVKRRSKADFTHLVNEGSENDYPKLIQNLDKGRAMDLGYVKGDVLKVKLEALRGGLKDPSCKSAWALSALIGLETWLQTFFRPNPTVKVH